MKQVNKNKIAVIYCRIATKDAKTTKELREQEKKCRQVAKADNSQVMKVIRDIGKSGNDLKRTGLKKLINFVKKQKVDIVYVKDAARLSRNMGDYVQLLKLFKSKGVAVKTLVEVQEGLASLVYARVSHAVRAN